MVITLTGSNSFTLGAALRQLLAEFVAQHGELAVEQLDGEEVEFERLAEAVTSLPFLASKKLVVLRAPGTNKTFQDQCEQLLAAIPETTEVIMVEPKLDKRSSYYKFLKRATDFRDFPELDQAGLVAWLVATAKQRGGKLSPTDARLLTERIGLNQRLLANELEKLLLYDPQISRATIELLTDETPQSTIFRLLEAAFAGRHHQTMELYAEQRALKVEPAQIIAMLTWQLHTLSIIKTAGDRPNTQIASEAKLNPFVVQKSQSIARGLTFARLKQLVSELLSIDRRLKRSNLDADEALQHYLLKLAEIS